MDDAFRRLLSGESDRLIAVDGLPCAGKSTLVERLEAEACAQCIYLDDFVLPRSDWRSERPGFPFGYIRYDDFAKAIEDIALHGSARYRPFDWDAGRVATEFKEITRGTPVIVEGVSALNPEFCAHYDEKVFVESDPVTLRAALARRGLGPWGIAPTCWLPAEGWVRSCLDLAACRVHLAVSKAVGDARPPCAGDERWSRKFSSMARRARQACRSASGSRAGATLRFSRSRPTSARISPRESAC